MSPQRASGNVLHAKRELMEALRLRSMPSTHHNLLENDKYKMMLENLFIYSYQNTMKLTQRDMNWFHDHTDIVEQYCACLAKILKSKYYDLFEKLNMENLSYLIKFAQLGLQLPEQYTLRAVAMFLEEFIKFTKTKNYLVELIQQNAFGLIEVVILVS